MSFEFDETSGIQSGAENTQVSSRRSFISNIFLKAGIKEEHLNYTLIGFAVIAFSLSVIIFIYR